MRENPAETVEGIRAERARRAAAWRRVARPDQLAPGTAGAANPRSDWTFWLLCAGRFFGKTRAGAEWVIEKARVMPKSHGALVAATSDDARKTMLSSGMEAVKGMSGILAVSPPDFRPTYEPSKRTLTWPNGSVATLYTAEEPDRLRGPQHHWAWVDEIAAWAGNQEAWDQLLFGLRLGVQPQACITTTPRPIPIIKRLLKDPHTVVTRGRSRDNAANVAPGIFDTVLSRYEGTRLGRQELEGEILEDAEGALWTGARIEKLRVVEAPELDLIVVAIDPAVTSTEDSDETGIVIAGSAWCDCKVKGGGESELHGFVLEDLSGMYSPDGWAQLAVSSYWRRTANYIVAEVNNGGDLVEVNLRTVDHRIAYESIHAARGKRTRAEPVAALYEQGKVHHVGGFSKLEDQMCSWEPLAGKRSPDRLDALVYALTKAMNLQEAPSNFQLMRRMYGAA